MNQYILFYDSGMGGITTLKECAKLLPHENFIYFADDKNMPYGNKKPEIISALVRANINAIMRRYSVKLIVLACNTATSAAKADLERDLDIPVVGIEPAIMLGAKVSKSGEIMCVATRATILGEKYHNLRKRTNAKVHSCIMPALARKIEEGFSSRIDIDREIEFLKSVMKTYPNIDRVVLGCTHYLAVKERLEKELGVECIDGNMGVARQVQRQLIGKNNIKEDGFMNLQIILSSGNVLKKKSYQDFFEKV